MKNIRYWIIFLILTTVSPLYLFAQQGPPWVKYNVGYNYIFRGIDFPSGQDNIGYMAGESLTYNGDGIVLKTTNGGTTWTPVWTGTNEGCEGSCFVDLNHGFIAGWPKLSNGWSGFGKTTDGGTTWTSPAVVADIFYFTDVVFKDANNGILMGPTNTSAGVWVTSNGGTTWTNATGLAGVPYHGCYVSGNTYFLADNAGHIQKSVNNGSTWTTVFTQAGLLLTGIKFFNNNIGMACGDNGVVVKTYDGGTTWALQLIGVDIWHDIGWETQEHVFVCGTPEIVAESTDGGTTWTNGFPQSSHQAALYECIFTAGGWGYICGSQGTLLKREPSCTAGFTASATSICTGDAVTFTSQSYGSNLSYNWTFEGGTPSSSTVPSPVITYNSGGVFDVRLIVSNGYWSDTLLKSNYITVSVHPAAPVITANGYTLSSNSSSGNQWYQDGVLIPGATSQDYTAQHSGMYWDVVIQNGCSSDTSNNIYLLMAGIPEIKGTTFTLTPVPNCGIFTITLSGSKELKYSLSVYNSIGTRIFQDDITMVNGKTSRFIDLHPAPSGIYTVEIKNSTGKLVRKMMIQH
jgi:photosystem II stability/assembly factor-like uncharacterized protein